MSGNVLSARYENTRIRFSFIHILEINPLSVVVSFVLFSPILRLSFHLVYSLLCRAKAFKFI